MTSFYYEMGQIWQGQNCCLQNHNYAWQLSKSVGWKINMVNNLYFI